VRVKKKKGGGKKCGGGIEKFGGGWGLRGFTDQKNCVWGGEVRGGCHTCAGFGKWKKRNKGRKTERGNLCLVAKQVKVAVTEGGGGGQTPWTKKKKGGVGGAAGGGTQRVHNNGRGGVCGPAVGGSDKGDVFGCGVGNTGLFLGGGGGWRGKDGFPKVGHKFGKGSKQVANTQFHQGVGFVRKWVWGKRVDTDNLFFSTHGGGKRGGKGQFVSTSPHRFWLGTMVEFKDPHVWGRERISKKEKEKKREQWIGSKRRY